MQRVATTVIAVVGALPAAELRALTAALGRAANVRAVVCGPEAAPLDRAVEAWSRAAGAHIPYLVHDADPLAEVAAAWIDRWDGAGDVGRLEVAVQAVLQRWRARSLELPDYYLLVEAERLAATARHWYLGVLGGAAPQRVAVTSAAPEEATRTVARLRAGRWWPELDVLLTGIERRVPDSPRVGEPATGVVV